MTLDTQSPEELAAAAKAVEELRKQQKPLRHVGRFADRMNLPCESSVREFAFASLWREENKTSAAVNLGVETLEALLCYDASNKRDRKEYSTREDIAVATVIQWLGTNVGFDFLRRALNNAGYVVLENGSLGLRARDFQERAS